MPPGLLQALGPVLEQRHVESKLFPKGDPFGVDCQIVSVTTKQA
jgi:hypothetical protein